jgi:hypothetical protein
VEITAEVKALYEQLLEELNKIGKIVVEEKKHHFILREGARRLPAYILAKPISSSILYLPLR